MTPYFTPSFSKYPKVDKLTATQNISLHIVHFQLNSLLANIFFYQVQFQFETNLRKLRCHFSFTPSVMRPCRIFISALIFFKNLEYQRATV